MGKMIGKATKVGMGSGSAKPGKTTASTGGRSSATRPSGKPLLSVPGAGKGPKGRTSPANIGPAPIKRMKSGMTAGKKGY